MLFSDAFPGFFEEGRIISEILVILALVMLLIQVIRTTLDD